MPLTRQVVRTRRKTSKPDNKLAMRQIVKIGKVRQTRVAKISKVTDLRHEKIGKTAGTITAGIMGGTMAAIPRTQLGELLLEWRLDPR